LSFGVGFACTTNVNPSAREYFFESLHAEFIAEGESNQGNGTRHPTSAAMPFCGYINQYISAFSSLHSMAPHSNCYNRK